ncbi:hypothetical protein F5Y15DRAFT_383208 [Xylariaceae sp. FL0016]|nr:hypothetical protein F5Y15DRAFT_383208 [Xylariaceae sp. FL0016]
MSDTIRTFTLVKALTGLAIAWWLLSYLRAPSNYHQITRKFRGERANFISDFRNHEISGLFDGSPITQLCESKKWTKDLLFTCTPQTGGIGEVRNGHLNCIRLATEAGAELVLPELVRRSELDIAQVVPLSKGTPRGVGLDYFYDTIHLSHSLSTYCPQMKVHRSIDDLFDVPMGNPIHINTRELSMDIINGSIFKYPQNWATVLDSYLDAKAPPKSRTSPLRVIIGQLLYKWPTSYDQTAFVQNFGRILRYRGDTKQLAGSALYTMQKRFKLSLDLRHGALSHANFAGVHLRTEKYGWGRFPSYDEQVAYYLDHLVNSRYSTVYLGSGTTTREIKAFTERALEFNITVATKKDLLDVAELDYLESLSWDQQAQVDYELLLRAGLVIGTCESSFAWNLALRRASSVGLVGGRTGPELNPEGHVRWNDGLSTIMGKTEENGNMQLSIWP